MNKRITWFSLLVLAVPLLLWPRVTTGDEAASQESKVTYDEHVRPIFREHCFSCHNQNGAKSGLALDSYTAVVAGGSSGEVVLAEDLESSRLWMLVSHEEEPIMPPGQDKLPEAKLNLISAWIEQGMPENSGSAVAKKKSVSLAIQPMTGKPEGPAAMPEGLPLEPVVYTPRPAAVSALAASPWAPLVAVAGQKQVSLYHTETTALLGVLPFPEGTPFVLRFSRDGSKLLVAGGRGGANGCAALYDVRTGQRLVTVGDELDAVLAADVNPELTRIALGGPSRIVRIYATETGELLHEIRKHTDWIYAIQYSPDGVLLATADRSNGLFVWEADTVREYLDLRGHTEAITSLSWRDDSNALASGSLDGTIRTWEMNDGKQIGRANAHGGGVNALCFAHDGSLASAGVDRTAKFWDASLKEIKKFPAFTEPALEVAVLFDGKQVVAGDWAGEVKMWRVEDAQPLAQFLPNPPTLEMRIQESEQQLAAAVQAAQQTAATLKAVQDKVAQTETQLAQAVRAASDNVTAATGAVAQAKQQVETSSSQVTQTTEAMNQAQMAVQEAERALQQATAQLRDAKTALQQAQQQEQASRAQLPEMQQRLESAQQALSQAQQQQKQGLEAMAKELPAPTEKAAAAAAEAARLEQLVAQLKAAQQQAPATK